MVKLTDTRSLTSDISNAVEEETSSHHSSLKELQCAILLLEKLSGAKSMVIDP